MYMVTIVGAVCMFVLFNLTALYAEHVGYIGW